MKKLSESYTNLSITYKALVAYKAATVQVKYWHIPARGAVVLSVGVNQMDLIAQRHRDVLERPTERTTAL